MWECHECPYKAQSKKIIDIHIRVDHDSVKYNCDVCEYK